MKKLRFERLHRIGSLIRAEVNGASMVDPLQKVLVITGAIPERGAMGEGEVEGGEAEEREKTVTTRERDQRAPCCQTGWSKS